MASSPSIEEHPKPRRVSYNEKPFAVRVKDPPGPGAKTGNLKLTHAIIGERPVEYLSESHNVVIAGSQLDVWKWLELKNRIDQRFIRDGQLEKVSPPKGEWDGTSSRFLTRNWRAVSKQKVGTMKKAPFWLRWLYSAVITKESHGFNSD